MLSFQLQLSALLLLLPFFVTTCFGASTFHDSFAAPPEEKPPPFRSLSDVELERFRPIIGASPGQASKRGSVWVLTNMI